VNSLYMGASRGHLCDSKAFLFHLLLSQPGFHFDPTFSVYQSSSLLCFFSFFDLHQFLILVWLRVLD